MHRLAVAYEIITCQQCPCGVFVAVETTQLVFDPYQIFQTQLTLNGGMLCKI